MCTAVRPYEEPDRSLNQGGSAIQGYVVAQGQGSRGECPSVTHEAQGSRGECPSVAHEAQGSQGECSSLTQNDACLSVVARAL